MSNKYKFRSYEDLYFTTQTVVNWADVFTRNLYKNIVIDSLKFCQEKKGLEIYAWVMMTNHLHFILGTHQNPLNEILRDFKSYTSRRIKDALYINNYESRRYWLTHMFEYEGHKNSNNEEWQFWQQDNHPIRLFNADITRQKLNYIHNNPVKAGFVEEPAHWVYSSAGDYLADRKGLLDILLLEGLYYD